MTLRRSAAALVLLLGSALLYSPQLGAQAGAQGRWVTLPSLMPINPIHIAMMHNGKVLIVAGSGNVASETNYQAAVWDPESGSIITQPVAWDMFCNGMVILPDGRVFVNGGNLQYDPFHGLPRNAVYDPMTGVFTDVQNMAHGRWYPTVTVLGDGSVMTFSGLSETGGTNNAVEIYTPGIGWSQEYLAGWTPPLYPRMHLLPDGTVLYAGSGTGSRIFNLSTKTWTGVIASTNYTSSRTYGSSVLLPLTLASGHTPRGMIFGGGNPATASTEILDLSVSPRKWKYGPPMSQPRTEMNATILPNGKVLAMGGSTINEDATTASLNADLYDPISNTFTSAGANAFPRLYHSSSLLLPDATVLLVGSNPQRGSYEAHMEAYSPAYLFNADGTEALRPTITSVTPGAFRYGATFHVGTSDAADIRSVVLVRPGASTHSIDMDQRLVELAHTAGAGELTVTSPPNGNIAPPGYYMLFILNSSGVPPVARFVQLSATIPNQPPTAQIVNPSGNVTVSAGQQVSFTGAANDADGTVSSYSWTFPGGNPAASTQLVPGHVTYQSPGTYVASFKATDNDGASSALAKRTVTVPNFSIAASPASRAIPAGTNTSYTATVTGTSGFADSVALNVSGLAPGVTASFSPAAIVGSGSSTLKVVTSVTTAPGTHPLTITGTTGAITRTATVNLVVSSSAVPGRIGIDFTGSTPVAMGAADVAGVVPMSNWNTAAGAASIAPLALLDATGAATGATVTWKANSVWMLPTVDQPGDRRMMKGYLDSTNTSTTTVSVARLAQRTYDVYVYVDGDNRTYDRPANYTLSGPGLTPTTIKVIDPASTNFAGTFTQAANGKGNYLKFTVTGGDFTLTATPEPGAGTRRAPVNALEIVPVVAAPPPGAGTIGVNFLGSSTVGLDSSEIAGLVAAANWNNASGAARSTPQLLVDVTRWLAPDYDGRRRGERTRSRSPARSSCPCARRGSG